MSVTVKRVEYFRTEVEDRPGGAYELFTALAKHEVNLLAVHSMPTGPSHTQFTLFPDVSDKLVRAIDRLGLTLAGPYPAMLIQGDDRLGALVDYHRRLAGARINVFATIGVTDGAGRYGYIIHVRPERFEEAANVLNAV